MATIAVFIALGGSSYAALTVTGRNIKNGTITSADVKDRSLLARDFRSGQLPAGPPGPQGATGSQGAQGPQGAQGASGASRLVIRGGGPGSDQAFCQAGERATGGGGITDGFLSES